MPPILSAGEKSESGTMMLPKVAILTNYPADHASFGGGVETATAALLEGLRQFQNSFEFHLVALSAGGSSDVVETKDGFYFHFLGPPRNRWLRPRLPFRIVRALRELRVIRPAVVHCQDNMALAVAAILGGYPRVFTVHGVKREEAWKRTRWEFWSSLADAYLERFVHRRFQFFICNSQYVARILGSGKSLFTVPNPVSGKYASGVPNEAAASSTLVFIGALTPLKRPLDLLVAHGELKTEFPDLELVICGTVEDRVYVGDMQRLMHKRAMHGIRFIGSRSQEELVRLLAGAAALVLPSGQENAPMVIAEAMSMGIPVIATRVGGIPEMVTDGKTGFLYEPGDVKGLAECIRSLLRDPEKRRAFGATARHLAQDKYSPTAVARATVEVYKTVMNVSAETGSFSRV